MLDPQTLELLRQMGIDQATAESALRLALWVTVATVAAAIPAALLARRRGRSFALWLIIGLTVPVLPLLLVWLLPPVKRDEDSGAPPQRGTG